MDKDRIEAALIGAYVADAAALGLHWLYDADRAAALSADGPAFLEPNAADFDGFMGVFVHHGKRAGDLSQYGVQLRVAVQTVIAGEGAFDVSAFQDRFAATFGAGGDWVGYMDKATKGTLANLAADQRAPSGADDDQVPAIAKLPAVMAARNASADLAAAAVAATNANETAALWSPLAARMLSAAYDGASPRDALDAAILDAPEEVGAAMRAARDSSIASTPDFAGEVGRACPLPQAMPVIAHILARSETYRDAVERNILAAGDNCGRAPVLGAVFGAAYGVGGGGVPLSWLGRLKDVATITADVEAVASLTSAS